MISPETALLIVSIAFAARLGWDVGAALLPMLEKLVKIAGIAIGWILYAIAAGAGWFFGALGGSAYRLGRRQ